MGFSARSLRPWASPVSFEPHPPGVEPGALPLVSGLLQATGMVGGDEEKGGADLLRCAGLSIREAGWGAYTAGAGRFWRGR